jgi:hypothetical protein
MSATIRFANIGKNQRQNAPKDMRNPCCESDWPVIPPGTRRGLISLGTWSWRGGLSIQGIMCFPKYRRFPLISKG